MEQPITWDRDFSAKEACYMIIKVYPCDDPYYPPNEVIFRVFTNEKKALRTMYNIYESIREDFESELKAFTIKEKKRAEMEKPQFLRSFIYPTFINYIIMRYDILDASDTTDATNFLKISQPCEEIFNLSIETINADLTITKRT